jgi:hypothetical protein
VHAGPDAGLPHDSADRRKLRCAVAHAKQAAARKKGTGSVRAGLHFNLVQVGKSCAMLQCYTASSSTQAANMPQLWMRVARGKCKQSQQQRKHTHTLQNSCPCSHSIKQIA